MGHFGAFLSNGFVFLVTKIKVRIFRTMAEFESKFIKLLIETRRKAFSEHERALKRFSEDVSRIVLADRGKVLVQDDWDSLDELIEVGVTYDSADFLLENCLGKNPRIDDIRIGSNDLDVIQERIDEVLDELPNRGFVYVSWSAKPERYFYVGKAGSRGRLRLRGHGTLTHSFREATTLSIVFPNNSIGDKLEMVETALFQVIKYSTGNPPELSQRCNNTLSHGECGIHQEKISRALESASRRLAPLRVR